MLNNVNALFETDIHSGESVDHPVGVLSVRKVVPHELPNELREPAGDDGLPDVPHQPELEGDVVDADHVAGGGLLDD